MLTMLVAKRGKKNRGASQLIAIIQFSQGLEIAKEKINFMEKFPHEHVSKLTQRTFSLLNAVMRGGRERKKAAHDNF
jgi:hypothetical protein